MNDNECGCETYYIEARQLSVAGVGGHNFWVLRNSMGEVVKELHGLATQYNENGTSEYIEMGTKKEHTLNAYELDPKLDDTFIKEGQQGRVVFSGGKEDVLKRWDNAKLIFEYINTLGPDGKGLGYPGLGIDLWGRAVNSNTVYAVFGRLMGLSVYAFPGKLEPGIMNENRLVLSEFIDECRQNLINAGVNVADKKVIDLSQKEYSDSFWENLANDKEGTEAGCGAGCQCGCQVMGPSPWWGQKPDINDLWDNAKRTSSPLVLDLNGNGISTTSLDNGVYFDHDGNGFAGKSGWLSKGEGILALDRNDNGVIDDGGELFGNNTLLANGKYAINGFEALKAFDINRDGVIDEKDAIYKDLKVWVDNNGDAFSDKDELLTLEEAGVKSINLGYINSNYVDEHGNAHKQQGSFTKADGTTAVINDVWFKVDYVGTISIDISQITTR